MAKINESKLDPAEAERPELRANEAEHSAEKGPRSPGESCDPSVKPESLAVIALRLFGEESGVDLELPPRQKGREPPSLD